MSKTLLFTIIASTIAATAFADTKTIPTQGYVDNTFQTKIPVSNLTFESSHETYNFPNTLVSSPTMNAGEIGEYGVLDYDLADLFSNAQIYELFDGFTNTIPTTGMVQEYVENELGGYQFIIPKTGFLNVNGYISPYSGDSAWLTTVVKGSTLVTRTDTDGQVGERQIIETADVANYGIGTTTEQQIQEISIPTMGAVMAAISANAPTLPTGTANSIVMYNANGNIGGSRTIATSVGTNTSATTIPTTGAVVTGLNTKQNKMTCTRYVENAEQTDANCLLWSIN